MDVREASEAMRVVLYRLKCEDFVSTWFCLMNYETMEEWFETNRCCIPVILSRLLDPRVIKHDTSL